MKLKDLVTDKFTRLKVIITESQFKRLTDNLLNNNSNDLQKELNEKRNGKQQSSPKRR